MKIELTSKTALVTGSAQGIGFAIARGLATAGASVVLNGLTKDEVDRAIERLQAELPAAEISGGARCEPQVCARNGCGPSVGRAAGNGNICGRPGHGRCSSAGRAASAPGSPPWWRACNRLRAK